MTPTPNTPEPAKWAVEAAKELEDTPLPTMSSFVIYANCVHARRTTMAAIIQRHADSAMEEMRKEISALKHENLNLENDRYLGLDDEKRDLRDQLAAAEAKVKELKKELSQRKRQAELYQTCLAGAVMAITDSAARTPKEDER